ncbi:MAG: hypothetical protein RLY71_2071 [Pseudomonadota bacterium]
MRSCLFRSSSKQKANADRLAFGSAIAFSLPRLALRLALLSCMASSACAWKNPRAPEMSAYGCLEELEVKDPTDKKLAATDTIKKFLTTNPTYHVATLDDIADHVETFQWCIREQSQIEYQKKFREDYFKPLITADTDGDRIPEMIAIMVKENKFNTIIFKGTKNGYASTPYWLIRDGPEIILGVSVQQDGLIIPHYCMACDSNPLIRWIESDYEVDGHLPGEQVCLAEKTNAHSAPDIKSKTTWQADKNQMVRIVRAGPRSDAVGTAPLGFRWYQIKSERTPRNTGYVPSHRFLESPGECD